MKIACLQFAPQVGDVNNNLNRADSVLAKANPDDLVDLDLIVLPELAFTGYNFKSLDDISPFVEPQGSGISALWARTTALKYDTHVIVGYPERVDVSAKWPAGPEYYSSAIVVNGDGETIANYRKSFLYATDETWALEGDDGFFAGDIPGLGNAAMGIGMDLNPYKFETPWHDFEFAYHVQAVEANLVIVSMAWLTGQDVRHFTRMPEEPDIETLTYWVQRLEPLIRTEGQDEIIVVFCNRTGIEGEVVYAGTSSVVGIQDGEVNVYGILGRGVKDLLVVDTENGPFAKLVQRPEALDNVSSQVSGMSRPPRKVASKPSTSPSPVDLPLRADSRQREPTPTPEDDLKPLRKTRLPSPRIQIPDSTYHRSRVVSQGTPIDDSPGVATPTCPSPTPLQFRPNVDDLATDEAGNYTRYTNSRQGWNDHSPQFCERHVSVEVPDSSTAAPLSSKLLDKYFRSDTQAPLKSPMAFQFPNVYKQNTAAAESPIPSAMMRMQHHEGGSLTKTLFGPEVTALHSTDSTHLCQIDHPEQLIDSGDATAVVQAGDSPSQEFTPPRPSSPKSRNASRAGRPPSRRHSEVEQHDISGTVKLIEPMARRPGSAAGLMHNGVEEPRLGRARVRQSSLPSQDLPLGTHQVLDQRQGVMSPSRIPLFSSPRMFSDTTVQTLFTAYGARGNVAVRPSTATGTTRPCPRAGTRSRNRSATGHSVTVLRERQNITSADNLAALRDAQPHIEPDETRTLIWSELAKMVGEVLRPPQARDVSRGRHLVSNHLTSSDVPTVTRESRSETRRGPRVIPRAEQRFASQVRSESVDQSVVSTNLAPDGTPGPLSPYDPDDEIVAEIIFHSQGRSAHSGIPSPQGRSVKAMPTPATTPAKASSGLRSQPGHGESSSRPSSSQQPTPQSHDLELPQSRSIQETRPSSQDPLSANVNAQDARPSSDMRSLDRVDSNGSCPTMDGASIMSVSSQKSSPRTPPARAFDPTTPKAMKFTHSSGSLLPAVDAPSDVDSAHLDSLQRELLSIGILRPKSVVW